MIEGLLKVNPTVEQIINDLKWTTFVNMLRNTHRPNSFTKARYVQTNIRRDGFWDTFDNFVHMAHGEIGFSDIKGI
jgi:hypothetical protein